MRLSEIQMQVLEYLQHYAQWATVKDIAQELEVHPNSVRISLRKLHNVNFVERSQQRDGKKGRPTLRFRARTGKFNILYDAFRAIEHASEIEKEIIESVISGKYEGCLAGAENLLESLRDFLGKIGVRAQISDSELLIRPEKYSEIDRDIPGFSGRVYRVIAQQAVGMRATVILHPSLREGKCVLSIYPNTES